MIGQHIKFPILAPNVIMMTNWNRNKDNAHQAWHGTWC
jgi:hypothetical protein